VDIEDLSGWVGKKDRGALEAARAALQEDEEADWEPAELELLDRLLERVVMQGQLYEGLPPEERYYLTQLLIDLFDEFVDSDAVTDEVPHERLVAALDTLRAREPSLEPLARFFSQGRTLGSEEILWPRDEDIDDLLPFFG